MSTHNFSRRQALKTGLSLFGGAAIGSRAELLRAQSLLSSLPSTSGQAAPRNLVMVQMFGGNDGLNTIVPYQSDEYHQLRPDIRLKPEEVLPIAENRGLHPNCANLANLWKQGEMAIVEGIGYPDPVLSHFKSFDIWNNASRTAVSFDGDGWLGRLRRMLWPNDFRSELMMHVGPHIPHSVFSQTHPCVTFERPERYVWVGDESAREAYGEAGDKAADSTGSNEMLERLRGTLKAAQSTSPRILEAVSSYEPKVDYAANDEFSANMKVVASLLKSDMGTRVFSVSIGNFDQHGPQRKAHDPLLQSLDRGVTSLLEDLRGTPEGENTLVVAFSEFGRRVKQNNSGGTDHGAAGPLFLFGQPVQGGLYGAAPSLTDLDKDGNLKFTTDFRSVYATIAQGWMGVSAEEALGGQWDMLPLLKG